MSIRIAIADDHPMIIKGLENMLSHYPHLELTGRYANGTELLERLKAGNVPDILLLDIQMPGQTGDELAPVLLKKYPELKILVLTNFESTLYLNNMLRHGVRGYLLKNTEEDILISAIQTVYEGGEFVEPSMKEKLRQLTVKMKREAGLKSSISLREKEILTCIVNGLTSEEIAEKLFLSVNTVNNYRLNMLLKLDANNTATLVKKALTLGLVDPT
jgi:DNA-binding NarL/FixJ family response regulator